ncbi:hypothetical protein D3C71_1580900 [compost metagenome]
MAAEQDDGGSAVAGDVGTTGVHHMRQIQSRQHLLDQLAAELAFHKGVGGNQAHKTGTDSVLGCDGQLKETFGERRTQRVLAVATGVLLPVGGVERGVLDDDVGRVAHHRVVLAAQDALHLGQVFAGVDVGQAGVGMAFGGVEQVLALRQAKTGAVQQAVANGDRHLEVVRIGQALHAGGLQSRHKQAKA